MKMQLITVLPDGVFAVTASDPLKFETYRLQYTARPEKMRAILAAAESEVRANPNRGLDYETLCAQAQAVEDLNLQQPDFEYQGVSIAALHGSLYDGIKRYGPPTGIVNGTTPPIPIDCSGVFYTDSNPAAGMCTWAKANREAHVALFFTRAQGAALLREVASVYVQDLRARKKELLCMPEQSSQKIVRFSGEGAKLLCYYLVVADLHAELRQKFLH